MLLNLGGIMQSFTKSFVQDQKHVEKTERFKVVQPSHLATVLADHGFDAVHVKSGKARKPDRADFQTTVARYRSRDRFSIDGLSMDIIIKAPHLYGAVQCVLGAFRGDCSNQLAVGKWFDSIKVRHTGSPIELLNAELPRLVEQREKLVDCIRAMQACKLSGAEIADLAVAIGDLRLENTDKTKLLSVTYADLLIRHRATDNATDLFTVFNVIQENAMRHALRYSVHGICKTSGLAIVRDRKTRLFKDETVAAIDFNASAWDVAQTVLTNKTAA